MDDAPSTAVRPVSSGPLEGIRIIDLTTVLMGPFATQLLGDMGADVIKVESPGGDGSRQLGIGRHPRMGGAFLNCNRNKRSIALDLKKDEGRAVLLALVKDADVVVSNIRPKAMERLGIGHRAFQSANSRIVTVSLVGYGQRGPYADKPAYDDLIQGVLAIPSLMAATGDGTPRYIPLVLMDRTVGMAAVNAILAALLFLQRTGRGQAIEVPMFETMVPFVLSEHLGGATFVPPQGPMGYARLLAPERQAYRTRDGYICVLIYNDRHWQNYFRLIGEEERGRSDPRFATLASRTAHASEICGMLSRELATRTTAQWLEAFEAADIPAMPLHTLDSLVQDEHLRAVDFFRETEHPSEGRILDMNPPGTWSVSQPTVRRLAPKLGEHTIEVLREAGYAPEAIERLVACGAAWAEAVHESSQ